MNRRKAKVLILGGKAPGFPSIAKALRKSEKYDIEIIAGCYKPSISAEQIADQVVIIPDYFGNKFNNELIKVLEKVKPDVVIPIRTGLLMKLLYLMTWFLENEVEVCLSVFEEDLLVKALNKSSMYDYLSERGGISVPENYFVEDRKEIPYYAHKLGYPHKEIAIKPCDSHGSRGFRILSATRDRQEVLFNDKPSSVYTNVERFIADAGDYHPELLMTEFFSGDEYTVDVLCYRGQTFAVVPRLRTRMRDGITVEGIVSRDRYDEIKEVCEKIVRLYGFSYCIGVQFRVDDNDKLQILEINPRLQGTTCLSVEAGVNIPEHMVAMALKEFDFDYEPQIKWGTKIDRIYKEYYKGDV